MKSIRKYILAAILAAFMLPASCWQNELFDLAKNGVPLVYAIITTTAGGSNRILMVTDGGDYYKEYMLYDESTMMNITDSVTNIAVSEHGEVYIKTVSEILYRSNHGLGYMKQLEAGGPVTVSWMVVHGDSLYVNDGSSTIWRYSEGWSSYPLPGTPTHMGNENGTGRPFFTYAPSTTWDFYWINESSYSMALTTTIGGLSPYFLSMGDGGYWIGANDKPYYKTLSLSVPGSPPAINGYCRIGSSLYCIDSNLFLHKSNKAKTDMYLFDPLPLPANPAFTYAFGDSKIVVSTGTPGFYLYFYNLEKKSCYVFNKNTSFTAFECMTVR